MLLQQPHLRLQPGNLLFNRYRVIRYLASGGVCHVYEGRDTQTSSRVAIRELQSPHPTSRERLRREWETLLRLQGHPAFPQVYEHGDHHGAPVLVEELLAGEDLRTLLGRRGLLPVQQVLRLAAELLDALEAVHALGCYHRDIKPDNLFLTAAGLKVLDLGLVHVFSYQGRQLTQAPSMTPRYAPPEQWRGEPPSRETDLYSAAVTLYELLTGRAHLPFTGDLRTDEQLVTTRQPTPMGRLTPALAPLDPPLLRALQPDPQRRPPSAAEMKRELLAAAAAAGLAPAQPSPVQWIARAIRSGRPARMPPGPRSPALLTLPGRAVAAALGLAVLILLLVFGGPPAPLTPAPREMRPPEPALRPPLSIPPIPVRPAAPDGTARPIAVPGPETRRMPSASTSGRGALVPPPTAGARGGTAEVVGDNVFLRQAPALTAPAAREKLRSGDRLALTGRRRSGWYEARLGDGLTGWVFGAHVLTRSARRDGVAVAALPLPLLDRPGPGTCLAELWPGKKLLVIGQEGKWLTVLCQAGGRIQAGYVPAAQVRWLERPGGL